MASFVLSPMFPSFNSPNTAEQTRARGHFRGFEERNTGSDLLPEGKNFPVVLLGFDNDNFAYVGPRTKKADDRWDKLDILLEEAVKTAKVVSYNDYKVGMMVMIKISNGKSQPPDLYRARIRVIPLCPGSKVECLRIDDFTVSHVLPKCILEIPWTIESLKPLAVQVQIDGLQFFNGLNVFNWKQNECRIFQRGTRSEIFSATKVGVTPEGLDVLMLVSYDNKNVVAKVQRLIRSVCKFEMIESVLSYSEYRQVGFTFVDDYCKYMWLQAPENPVLNRITEVLSTFTPKERTEEQTKDIATYSSMQNEFDVFVVDFEGIWYRCKIIKVEESEGDEEEKVHVEYLDFGGFCIVPTASLYPASQIDYNLCLIPPQCTKARVNQSEDQTLKPFFEEMVKGEAKIWVRVSLKTMATGVPVLDVLIPEGFFTDLARNKEPVANSEESGVCCSYASSEDLTLLEIKELVDEEVAADVEANRINYENLGQTDLTSINTLSVSASASTSAIEEKETTSGIEEIETPSDNSDQYEPRTANLSSTERERLKILLAKQLALLEAEEDLPLTLIPIGPRRNNQKTMTSDDLNALLSGTSQLVRQKSATTTCDKFPPSPSSESYARPSSNPRPSSSSASSSSKTPTSLSARNDSSSSDTSSRIWR